MTSPPRPRRDPPQRGPALPLALALSLGALGALPAPARAGARPAAVQATTQAPGQPISPEALEARHGLRVTRVAVTGNGGLVDLRFTVLDPGKARPLLEGGEQGLRLLPEQGGVALDAPHHGAMRNVRLAPDAACFVLFPNVRGAVRPGGRVSVAFGSVRLQPLAVQ